MAFKNYGKHQKYKTFFWLWKSIKKWQKIIPKLRYKRTQQIPHSLCLNSIGNICNLNPIINHVRWTWNNFIWCQVFNEFSFLLILQLLTNLLPQQVLNPINYAKNSTAAFLQEGSILDLKKTRLKETRKAKIVTYCSIYLF